MDVSFVQLIFQHLQFPTRIPLPVGYWTENLLQKYGADVRSFTVRLSKDWLRKFSLPKLEYQNVTHSQYMSTKSEQLENRELSLEDTDNTLRILKGHALEIKHLSEHYFENISPHNTVTIISHCPNVKFLSLSCLIHNLIWSDEIAMYASQLASIVSGLKKVEELELCSRSGEIALELVKVFPLLKTLTFNDVNGSMTRNVATMFGGALSQLNHLTTLNLYNCNRIDDSWSGWSGLQKLTNLRIHKCYHFQPVQAVRALNKFPGRENITHLHLAFEEPETEESLEILDEQLFHLPALVELDLHEFPLQDVLPCFRNCSTVRHLTYRDFPVQKWRALRNFFRTSTWPMLKNIKIELQAPYDFESKATHTSSLKLDKSANTHES